MELLQLQTAWVVEKDMEAASIGELYTYCLMWSLAQSGFNSWIGTAPTNWFERLFTSAIGMLWMVVFAFLCAHFTLWVIQIRDSQIEHEQTMGKVRKFLKENRVSPTVGNSMVRFARRYTNKLLVKMKESDIPIFNDLPLGLRMMLHRQIFAPILNSHPAFSLLCGIALDSICHLACSNEHYGAGATIFEKGTVANNMIYVRSGELNYYLSRQRDPWPVEVDMWVSEVALWRRWKHVGCFICRTSSELTLIDCAKFNSILSESKHYGLDLSAIRAYARLALAHCCDKQPLTDLWDYDDHMANVVGRTITHSPSPVYVEAA
jgi:hypothetical protein